MAYFAKRFVYSKQIKIMIIVDLFAYFFKDALVSYILVLNDRLKLSLSETALKVHFVEKLT